MKRCLSVFFIVTLNILSLLFAIFIIEYETAKILNPESLWINSPQTIDYVFMSFVLFSSLLSISANVIKLIKKLDYPTIVISGKNYNLLIPIKTLTALNYVFIGIIVLLLNDNISFILFP